MPLTQAERRKIQRWIRAHNIAANTDHGHAWMAYAYRNVLETFSIPTAKRHTRKRGKK